jgi:hypothetical protein
MAHAENVIEVGKRVNHVERVSRDLQRQRRRALR